MKTQGQIDAELYLDRVFSAEKELDKAIGSDLTFDKILAAAKQWGWNFSEDELRAAIAEKLQPPRGAQTVQIVRFCFSESPHA